jgi:hypothetical protein
MNDPTINVQLRHRTEISHQGLGFFNLLAFGLTQEVVAVMTEMLSFTVLVEDFLQGRIKNPDILAMVAMRDRAHLHLLALPTAAVLFGPLKSSGIYDCCRYAALLFSSCVLFPMPNSTGIPIRLIKEIKTCVDQASFVALVAEGTRPFFIWVLMLIAIAAAGLPEQQWAKERLTDLLTVEGVSKWNEIKKIVESFLWMEFACDGGAMDLWDDIAGHVRGDV